MLQVTALTILFLAPFCQAAVEWQAGKKIDVGESPLDIAATSNGKMTFVLTDSGTVFIYSEGGTLKDKISVGKSYDGIEVSPKGDKLYLKSSKDKAVQIISLDFIVEINTAGSPYKGPADAKVVVAVFSDFQ
jgi:DNA-binding beta-propeller fold protein YncE